MEIMAKVCKAERMNFERLAARVFVVAGGLFWVAGVLGANIAYQDSSLFEAAGTALIPLAVTVIALGIGWFYENLAAVLLLVGAVGGIVWGVIAGWEAAVWVLMAGVLLAPMVIAALLFFLAGRMQRICELEV